MAVLSLLFRFLIGLRSLEEKDSEIDGFTSCETYLEKEVQKSHMKSTSLHGATSLEACEAPSHKRLR